MSFARDDLVVTVRYPVIHWHAADPMTPVTTRATPGLALERVRSHVLEFVEHDAVFGLRVEAALLARITSSYFAALDLARAVANSIEDRVSDEETRETTERKDILGLRRLLRQVRWAFVPVDEIGELLVWPTPEHRDERVDAHLADAQAESARASVTAQEVMEQVQQTFELLQLTKQDTIEATTCRLTVVATLLLPPSLIAGIYGMNFRYIPFLQTRAAFVAALGVMVVASALSWFLVKRGLPVPPRDTAKRRGSPL